MPSGCRCGSYKLAAGDGYEPSVVASGLFSAADWALLRQTARATGAWVLGGTATGGDWFTGYYPGFGAGHIACGGAGRYASPISAVCLLSHSRNYLRPCLLFELDNHQPAPTDWTRPLLHQKVFQSLSPRTRNLVHLHPPTLYLHYLSSLSSWEG